MRRWGTGLGCMADHRVGVTPVMVSSSPPHLSTPLPSAIQGTTPSAVATPFPPSQVLG